MSSAAAYDSTEREERAPSFVAGAWLNRKWTRSSSSILLGLIPTALLVLSGGQLPVIGPALVDAGVLTPESAPVVAGVTAAIALLNLLLFPFAREMYYRTTAPMRDGLAGMMVFGWLFLVVIICKIAMFLAIWAVSIPAGLVSLLTLGEEDRRGRGWRIS